MPGLSDIAPHWAWLTLGLSLAIAEVIAPGLFLIWLAGAALFTGVVTWLHPLSVPMQVFLFADTAIASVLLARRALRHGADPAIDPMLNDRGLRLLGESVVVTQPIVAGSGRVRQGDGEWPASGPDAPAGARMRVIGRDGVVLSVEPAD